MTNQNETDRELLNRLQREGRFDPNTDDEYDAIRDLDPDRFGPIRKPYSYRRYG